MEETEENSRAAAAGGAGGATESGNLGRLSLPGTLEDAAGGAPRGDASASAATGGGKRGGEWRRGGGRGRGSFSSSKSLLPALPVPETVII